MYNQRVTEKGALQQALLQRSLLEMLETVPFEKITVINLCEHAGLSRKTFYRLFTDKTDVLYALVDQTITNYINFEYPDAIDTVEAPARMQQFLAYWKSQKAFLDILKKNKMITVLFERSIDHIMNEDFSTMQKFGAYEHPDAKEIILFRYSSILSLVVYWYKRGYHQSIPEMAALMCQLLTNPLPHLPDDSSQK